MSDWLPDFVAESNRIEGILRNPTKAEIEAHLSFLEREIVTIDDLVQFVSVVQPNARLRDREEVPGVRVGDHVAPKSGGIIVGALHGILQAARGQNDFEASSYVSHVAKAGDPFSVHCAYETLHPFTDGNGRSGRALWLWMMLRGEERDHAQATSLGFLHTFYYQTLSAKRQ